MAAILVLGIAPDAGAQQGKERVLADGRSDYLDHCAACHGDSGRGDGRMAKILIIPPSDLTVIAKKYDGEFPFWRVYDIVSGVIEVPGHETIQMPRFWEKFSGDVGKPGYLPPDIRVLLLTHYVQSLQTR